MSDYHKIRLVATGEELAFRWTGRYGTFLSEVRDTTENDQLTEADYEVLDESAINRDEWEDFAGMRLENDNYHSEHRALSRIVGFFSVDADACAFLKAVAEGQVF